MGLSRRCRIESARIEYLEQIVVEAYNWVGVKPTEDTVSVSYRNLMKEITKVRFERIIGLIEISD